MVVLLERQRLSAEQEASLAWPSTPSHDHLCTGHCNPDCQRVGEDGCTREDEWRPDHAVDAGMKYMELERVNNGDLADRGVQNLLDVCNRALA